MLEHVEPMLRDTFDAICRNVEQIDGARFHEKVWEQPGGSVIIDRILEDGNVFERAGINFAVVHSTLSPEMMRVAMGGATHAAPPTAAPPSGPVQISVTSLSLVIHPHNPLAPTAHANYRYFQIDDQPDVWWFGGGADLTPSYLFEEDAIHFHQTLRDACDSCDPAFYPRFKRDCDSYFYLPHRGEARGVGGIFFDTLRDRPFDQLLPFITNCAQSFLPGYLPIVHRRKDLPYTAEQKHWQGLRRGRYVEFNLIHDRGTVFGMKSDFVNPQSILMSLPLVARWAYDYQPAADSDEARMLDVLRHPREWLAADAMPLETLPTAAVPVAA